MPDRSRERTPAPEPFASLECGPEPDVTWGAGGIDDYGWTRWPKPEDTTRGATDWQVAA